MDQTNNNEDTQDVEDIKLSHFAAARIAVVAFERGGVAMPAQIIVADTETDKFYCVAQMADQIEMPEEEVAIIKDFLENNVRNAQRNTQIMDLPIGPDGRPMMPPGMSIGPGGMILPKG